MIVIFSYNRPDMLARLIDECPERPVVIDDGSDFDSLLFAKKCDFHRLEHKGREGFWENWDYALKICEASNDEYFTFLPDDFSSVQFDVLETFKQEKPFAYNLLNDGRTQCFIACKPVETEFHGIPSIQVAFTDCGYHCNRKALEILNFTMPPVDQIRFDDPNASSQVGMYQSTQFFINFVPMYIPKKSLVKHGDHPSMMHPELRKKVPLVNQ